MSAFYTQSLSAMFIVSLSNSDFYPSHESIPQIVKVEGPIPFTTMLVLSQVSLDHLRGSNRQDKAYTNVRAGMPESFVMFLEMATLLFRV